MRTKADLRCSWDTPWCNPSSGAHSRDRWLATTDAILFVRPIDPSGKSLPDFKNPLSSPICKNISVFPKCKSAYMTGHPVPPRGVSRSSRTREGMRWTRAASARNGVAGRLTRERSTGAQDDGADRVRQNRVVLTPQRLASSLRRPVIPTGL